MIYEKIDRIYSFIHRRFYNNDDYMPEQSSYDYKGLDPILFGSVLPNAEKSGASTLDEALIRYFLIHFKHWSKYQPQHLIEFHWVLGIKAVKRWKRDGGKGYGYDHIYYRGLLSKLGITIDDIKAHMIEGDGQSEIDIALVHQGIKDMYSASLPSFFEPKEYIDSAYDILSALGNEHLENIEEIMSRIVSAIKSEVEGKNDYYQFIKEDFKDSTIDDLIVSYFEERINEMKKHENSEDYRIYFEDKGERIKHYIKEGAFNSFVRSSYKGLLKLHEERQTSS